VTVAARCTFGLRSLDEDGTVKQETFAVSGGIIF